MSYTADFFRARLDEMVDIKHPLVVLGKRLPWGAIERALAPPSSTPTARIATISLADVN